VLPFPTMNDRSRAFVAALVLALGLGGCDTPIDTSPSPTPFVAPSLPAHIAESPLVLHTWNEAGFGADLSGRLVLEDGCLYIVSDDSGGRWLPSWPYPGTDWDGTAVVSEGAVIPLGELAVFGGGEGDLTEANVEGLDWVNPPDPACLTTGKAWWVYAGSAPP